MSGETDLGKLLASMRPELQPHVHVFVTVPEGYALPPAFEPVMIFREREGTTLILREDQARSANLAGTFRCRMITLTVHSALEGVGFLAAIAARLSAAGIGSNPVSAFYHDHLFVPADRADDAMRVLQEFSSGGDGAFLAIEQLAALGVVQGER